ncbi:MAG TPA: hypothetical protein VGB30_07505 [bacterium]
MSRLINYCIFITIISMFFLSCGGVNSNPTAPNFNQNNNANAPGANQEGGPGANVPTTPEELMGQLSAGGGSTGEEIIQGTFETLWPMGLQKLEEGDTLLAGQYFKSAFSQNPQSADAALAYALTDIMRDHRRYAIFMHPGVDKLFTSTPLIGIPEAFPNPFLASDSYILRLAALGNRTRSLKPGVIYPILAQIDTNQMFVPELYANLMGQATHPEPGGDMDGVRVEEEAPPADNPLEGEDPGMHQPPPPPNDPGPSGRSTQIPKNNIHKQGSGVLGPGGGEDDGSGDGAGDGRGDEPFVYEYGSGPVGGGPGGVPGIGLPEREEPVSEDEWEELLNQYRDSAGRDGADIIISPSLYQNLKTFHGEIQEHIKNLESIKTIIEEEGYKLGLPFNVVDGTLKITLQFDVNDYHILIDQYRMIDNILTYVLSYQTGLAFRFPTDEIVDKNGDNILQPDEYIPAAPFGTLNEEGKTTLQNLHNTFVQTLSNHSVVMQPLFDDARLVQAGDIEPKKLFYLSSFHRDFVMIEEWVDHLRDIADTSSSGLNIKLGASPQMVDILVTYDALFNTPVEDIRGPLPDYDPVAGIAVFDVDGNWSAEPTYNGFFTEGLDTVGIYYTKGRMSAVIYDDTMAKAKDATLTIESSSEKANDNGVAILPDVTINEIVGTHFTVKKADGTELGGGIVRSLYEVLPMFDMTVIQSIIGAAPGDKITIQAPEDMIDSIEHQISSPGAGDTTDTGMTPSDSDDGTEQAGDESGEGSGDESGSGTEPPPDDNGGDEGDDSGQENDESGAGDDGNGNSGSDDSGDSV